MTITLYYGIYIYICIHICIHTYACICAHIYAYVCMHFMHSHKYGSEEATAGRVVSPCSIMVHHGLTS